MTAGDVIVGFVGLFTCLVLYAAYKSEPDLPQDLQAEVFRRRLANRNNKTFPVWMPLFIGNANLGVPDTAANAHAATEHCADATVSSHACGGHVGGH
jgi:hypothetical protein